MAKPENKNRFDMKDYLNKSGDGGIRYRGDFGDCYEFRNTG